MFFIPYAKPQSMFMHFIPKPATPGPGDYHSPAKYTDKSKGVKFTHDKRSKDKKDYLPGPGNYKIPWRVYDIADYKLPNRDKTFKYV